MVRQRESNTNKLGFLIFYLGRYIICCSLDLELYSKGQPAMRGFYCIHLFSLCLERLILSAMLQSNHLTSAWAIFKYISSTPTQETYKRVICLSMKLLYCVIGEFDCEPHYGQGLIYTTYVYRTAEYLVLTI